MTVVWRVLLCSCQVIFVDADQIVRTDMKALMDLDLKGACPLTWQLNQQRPDTDPTTPLSACSCAGAPLGYTPMCDNAREMDGFRFWKQARTHTQRGLSAACLR